MNLKLLIILILNVLILSDAFARGVAGRAGGRGITNRQLNRDLGRWENDLADNAYQGEGGGAAGVEGEATGSAAAAPTVNCDMDGDCSAGQKCSSRGICIGK